MNIIPPRTGDVLHDPFSLIGWLDRVRTVLNNIFSSAASNSLGSDVALNNTGLYFTGPSVAWPVGIPCFASGGVTLTTSAGTDLMAVKLWDGTTVIASAQVSVPTNAVVYVHLSGTLTSPAGNIRISCNDGGSTNGTIKFNASGNSKDSTLTVTRNG